MKRHDVSVRMSVREYDIEGFDKPTGFSIAMGIPFKGSNENVSSAIEFGYANLGESNGEFEGIDMTLSATSLFFLSRFNFEVAPKSELFAKIGINSFTAKAEAQSNGFTSSADETEMKLMYSFGAQYQIAPKSTIGLDYTSYEADTTAVAVNLGIKL